MPDHTEDGDFRYSVRIPADVGRPDHVLGPLTARQTAILAGTAGVLWLGYGATRSLLAPLAYLVLVTPVAAVVTAVALGNRDGISMDRFVLAAIAFRRSPKRHVHAPEGIPDPPDFLPPPLADRTGPVPAVLRMPCKQLLEPGVLDLGRDGYGALAACSTVNFDLRSGAEQQALTGAFARWLNSLTGPAQIIVRAHRLDIGPLADRISRTAPALPHPALEQTALAHANFLQDLASHSDLLTRQVLLAVREPSGGTAGRGGPARVRQRIAEASRGLAAADVCVTALDPDQITAAVTDAIAAETSSASGPDRVEGGEAV
jgi:PrgI family protein